MVMNDVPKRFRHEEITPQVAREALAYYRPLLTHDCEDVRRFALGELAFWGAILKGLEATENAAG